LIIAFFGIHILDTSVDQTHAILQKAFDDVIKDGIRKNPGDERD
jgi:hypothetical protein